VIAPARLASILFAAVALGTPASAAGEVQRPIGASAKRVADAFVRALVVKHDPRGAAEFTRAQPAELRKLNAGFVRDGVDTLVGQSRILRGCKAAAREKPSPRGDCVRYRVRGSRRIGRGERVTEGDLRIWLRQETGRWRVWAYAYSAEVTDCPTGCK
jgi:hypothetical protein